VALGNVEVDEQRGNGLGSHAGAAIGVQRQHARLDVVTTHGVGDQLLGQVGVLAIGNQPADDMAAEDIHDHVQVEAAPLHRAAQLRDVPRPNLIGRQSQ